METRHGNHVVDLIFFKFECLDYVFYFELEEVDEENLVIEGHDYFAQSNFDLFDFGGEGHVSDDFLSL